MKKEEEGAGNCFIVLLLNCFIVEKRTEPTGCKEIIQIRILLQFFMPFFLNNVIRYLQLEIRVLQGL
jgi:hypothetical protein